MGRMGIEGKSLLPTAGESNPGEILEMPALPETCCASFCRYLLYVLGVLLMFIPIFWCIYIKVFEQYERCVHFRLGKLCPPAKGPGLFFFIPFVDTWRVVDLRVCTIDVPAQEMMTKDSVTVHVNAVVYYHILEPTKAIICVQDDKRATGSLAQTTLRAVIGESELDELLQKREVVNAKIRRILDVATDPWGVKVTGVELQDVVLPRQMQRAMGSQAEAERARRAKVISAEGELQASRALLAAANEMTRNPATIHLRFLQTLTQIAQEQNVTEIFPFPTELISLVDNFNQRMVLERGATIASMPFPTIVTK